MDPKVSIILVNYNGLNDTLECLESLKKISYSNYEIVVVDNASTERINSAQQKRIEEQAYYIKNNQNLGFSGGNNVGIRYALNEGTDYILLLNNDTTVEPDFLNVLVTEAEKNKEEIGIIGGKILYFYDPGKIWFGGGVFDKRSGNSWHINQDCKDDQTDKEIKEISFMTGCLMLIPKTVINKVGMLEESYFLYWEDVDYCCRVSESGYKILYCPQAVIYHKVNAATKKSSDLQSYYILRNQLEIIRKYAKQPITAFLRRLYISIKDILRGRKRMYVVIDAYIDFLRHRLGQTNRKL